MGNRDEEMFYRPSYLKVRDVFNLAAVVDHHPDVLRAGMAEIEDRLPRLLNRIDLLRPVYGRLAIDDVNPTESGRKYMTAAVIESVVEFLRAYRPESAPHLD